MSSTNDTTIGHGTNGSPQSNIEEYLYPTHQKMVEVNETISIAHPKYVPGPKHEPGHNWGSIDPVKSQTEGQILLDTGYKNGKQIYNITDDGIIIKFQPDGTPQNGYHSYKVSTPRDIPPSVLKEMLNDGKISHTEYNKLRKGKR